MSLEPEEFHERARLGACYIAQIVPGDDLMEKISDIAKLREIRRLVVLSAIGSFVDVHFRNLKPEAQLPLRGEHWADGGGTGPYELLALNGNMVPMGGEPVLHVHALFGTPDGKVIGGHLHRAVALTTGELFLVEIAESRVVRQRSEQLGITEMKVAR